MDLKQITRKMKTESAKLKKQVGAEVNKLEVAPAKLKKQLMAEVKKLEGVPAKLIKQIEALPGRAVSAAGIVSASQLKAVRAELGRLSKRIDTLSKQQAA